MKKFLIILLAIVVAGAAGFCIYWFAFRDKGDTNPPSGVEIRINDAENYDGINAVAKLNETKTQFALFVDDSTDTAISLAAETEDYHMEDLVYYTNAQGQRYEFSLKSEDVIYWYDMPSSNVTFSAKLSKVGFDAQTKTFTLGRNQTLASVKSDLATNAADITTLILPVTATNLTNELNALSKVETVDCSQKVTTIGDRCFMNCAELKTINLSGATTIGNNAFSGCTKLANINLPKVQTINAYAFYGTAIDSFTIPTTLETVANHAFDNTPNLNTIIIDGNLDWIVEKELDLQPIFDKQCNIELKNVAFTECAENPIINEIVGANASIKFKDSNTTYCKDSYGLYPEITLVDAENECKFERIISGEDSYFRLVKTTIDENYDIICFVDDMGTRYELNTNYDYSDEMPTTLHAICSKNSDIITLSSGENIYNYFILNNDKTNLIVKTDGTLLSTTDIREKLYACYLPKNSHKAINNEQIVVGDTTFTIIDDNGTLKLVYQPTLSLNDADNNKLTILPGIEYNVVEHSYNVANANLNIISTIADGNITFTLTYTLTTDAKVELFNAENLYGAVMLTHEIDGKQYILTTEDNAEELSYIKKLCETTNSTTEYIWEFAGKYDAVFFDSNVTYIPEKLLANCYSISFISMTENVYRLGNSAFEGCSNLENIQIFADEIGTDSLNGCTKLAKITTNNLPTGGLKVLVGERQVARITDVNFTGTTLVQNAFEGATSLVNVALDNVTIITDYSFKDCKKLETISLANVQRIGISAFENCTSLKKVEIPDNVIFSQAAFKNCTGLKEISLGANLTMWNFKPFEGCLNITKINTKDFSDNLLFKLFGEKPEGQTQRLNLEITTETDRAKSVDSTQTTYLDEIVTFTANELTNMPAGILAAMTSLRTLSAEKLTLDLLALSALTELTDVNAYNITANLTEERALPQNLETLTLDADALENGVFKSLNLKGIDLVLPNLEVVGASAFEECEIGSLTLEKVKTIGADAFKNATMAKLTIPAIETIGESAFEGLNGNYSINCDASKQAEFETLKTIGACAFKDSGLKAINLGEVLQSIDGPNVFADTEITTLSLPESLTQLATGAFASMYSLEKVDMVTIDSYLKFKSYFADEQNAVPAIYEITLNCKGGALPDNYFQDIESVTEITINNVEQIIPAFFTTINLQKLTINAVKDKTLIINSNAFKINCKVARTTSNLQELTINAKAIELRGSNIFENIGFNLELNNTQALLDRDAIFAGYKGTEITLANVTRIASGKEPFLGAENLLSIVMPKNRLNGEFVIKKDAKTQVDAVRIVYEGDGNQTCRLEYHNYIRLTFKDQIRDAGGKYDQNNWRVTAGLWLNGVKIDTSEPGITVDKVHLTGNDIFDTNNVGTGVCVLDTWTSDPNEEYTLKIWCQRKDYWATNDSQDKLTFKGTNGSYTINSPEKSTGATSEASFKLDNIFINENIVVTMKK